MIVIKNKVFAIVSKYDRIVILIQQLQEDPDYTELKFSDTMVENHKTTTVWRYVSLDTVTSIYGLPTWVNPD